MSQFSSNVLFLYSFDLEDVGLEDSFEATEMPPIVFPKLHSTKFSGLNRTSTQFAFQVISPPNLNQLRFDDIDISNQDGRSSNTGGRKWLSAFFAGIEPTSLRTLRIIQEDMTEPDFMAILSASQGLEEVHLGENEAVGPGLLEWLEGKTGDASSTCPNLKTLKLESCSAVNSRSVKNLVEARQAVGRPLQTLSVRYCNVEEDLKEWLEARVPNVTLEEDSDDSSMGDGDDLDDLDMVTTDGEGPPDLEMTDDEW